MYIGVQAFGINVQSNFILIKALKFYIYHNVCWCLAAVGHEFWSGVNCVTCDHKADADVNVVKLSTTDHLHSPR